MPIFEPSKRHLREALLFCFNLKKTAAESCPMLMEAYGTMLRQKQRAKNGSDALVVVISMLGTSNAMEGQTFLKTKNFNH